MRLRSLEVEGFQSYETHQAVNIEPDVTILAGRNNVGKSGLLRALRLPVESVAGFGPNLRLSYTWTLDLHELLSRITVERDHALLAIIQAEAQRGIRTLKADFATYNTTTTYPRLHLDRTPGVTLSGGVFATSIKIEDTPIKLQAYSGTNSDSDISSPQRLWWDETIGYEEVSIQVAMVIFRLLSEWFSQIYYIHPRRSTNRMGFSTTKSLLSDGAT